MGTATEFFFQSRDGQNRMLFPVSRVAQGFSVSPDRKTFLFGKFTTFGDDLILAENFR